MRVAQVQGQSHNVTYPCQSVDPYRLRAATSAKDRRAEAAPNGGSTCGYAKTCSPRLVGRQRYARATTASSPGPGHCDCRHRAGDGPLPSRCPAIRRSLRPCRNSADSTGTWVRPQIPGFSPGGLGPHLTSSGSRAGFPPVSRLPTRALPRRPPSSGFPTLGVLRFRPFGRRFPVRFPSDSLRVPFPLSNLHVSAAARRFCGRWSRAAGTKVTSSRRDPWLRSCRSARNADIPRERTGSRGAAGWPHHRLHLGSRDDPGSWQPDAGSFQRRARPGP